MGDISAFSTYADFTSDIGSSGLNVLIGTSIGAFSPSGTISSGNPVPGWTTPTITNPTGATTFYEIYRATFSGGVTTEPEELISTVQSTNSYLDLDRTATSYNGTTLPGIHSNWVSYRVVAYNSGVTRTGSTAYFITP
jgi:hypothetical protein